MMIRVVLLGVGTAAVTAFGSIPTGCSGGKRCSGATYTLCNPDPDVLVWDDPWETARTLMNAHGSAMLNVGWLKVPILYDQPGLEELGTPLGYTALRVSVATTCAPTAKPILSHCGGPASGNECLEQADGRAPARVHAGTCDP